MTADARARKLLEWVRAQVVGGRTTAFETFEAQEAGLGSETEVLEAFLINVERSWLTGEVTVLCPHGHNLGTWPVAGRKLQIPDDECSMCSDEERQPPGDEELFFNFAPRDDWLADIGKPPQEVAIPSALRPHQRTSSRGGADVRAAGAPPA